MRSGCPGRIWGPGVSAWEASCHVAVRVPGMSRSMQGGGMRGNLPSGCAERRSGRARSMLRWDQMPCDQLVPIPRVHGGACRCRRCCRSWRVRRYHTLPDWRQGEAANIPWLKGRGNYIERSSSRHSEVLPRGMSPFQDADACSSRRKVAHDIHSSFRCHDPGRPATHEGSLGGCTEARRDVNRIVRGLKLEVDRVP